MKLHLVLITIIFLSSCSVWRQQSGHTVTETAQPTVMLATESALSATEAIVPNPSKSPISTSAPVATITPVPTSTPHEAPSPPPSPTSPLQTTSFAVIGDYGTTGVGSQEVAALVDGWDPDLVITVGDNNYPDGAAGTIAGNITQHYGRFIAEGRFFPTLGNHDMTTDFGRPYLEYFELPGNERYYDFVRGDVHFFAINSDWREVDGISATSRQAAWLQQGLSASTTTWQVVYFHAPPYVSMAAKQVPVMRWPFAQWGADLVFSGHAHLYERLLVDGIPYVVNGLGGGGIYAFDDQAVPGSEVRFNGNYGALLVQATEAGLTLQFVTRAGTIVDQMTLPAPG